MKINRDLIIILIIVIIGMFIPFFGSIIINFGLDFTKPVDLIKVVSTFGWFLIIFAVELIVVFIYFQTTSKIAEKKLEKLKLK
jgi:multisubunit Na+/H+ antiporter MnhG subunit